MVYVAALTTCPFNKIPHNDVYLSLTTEEVYVVAFFKVMQQQTTREVANSITYFWADNFCLQQLKNGVV